MKITILGLIFVAAALAGCAALRDYTEARISAPRYLPDGQGGFYLEGRTGNLKVFGE